MINAENSIDDNDSAILVMSPATGMLVGVYWGARLDVCHSVDEFVDPNECRYCHCNAGGIRLGCFVGEEEISLKQYRKKNDEESVSDESSDVDLVALSDNLFHQLSSDDDVWKPLVPPGYVYVAGVGITKDDAEWN